MNDEDEWLKKMEAIEVKWEEDAWEIDEQHVASRPDDIGSLDGTYFDARAMLAEVLEELNEQGKLDFWLIKHPKIRSFWARYQARKRIQKVHADALEKLRTQFTEEELDTLKIRLPRA